MKLPRVDVLINTVFQEWDDCLENPPLSKLHPPGSPRQVTLIDSVSYIKVESMEVKFQTKLHQ